MSWEGLEGPCASEAKQEAQMRTATSCRGWKGWHRLWLRLIVVVMAILLPNEGAHRANHSCCSPPRGILLYAPYQRESSDIWQPAEMFQDIRQPLNCLK